MTDVQAFPVETDVPAPDPQSHPIDSEDQFLTARADVGTSDHASEHPRKETVYYDAEDGYNEGKVSVKAGCLGCCTCIRRRPRQQRTAVPGIRQDIPPPPPPPLPPHGRPQGESMEPYWSHSRINLLRQPTVTPVPELHEITINSREDDIFYSMEEAALDPSNLYVDDDEVEDAQAPLSRRSSLSSRDSLSRAGSLKAALAKIARRLSSRRDLGRVDHLLTEEPGDELNLVTGPLSPEEMTEISRFAGTWKADRSMSDDYDGMCKIMQLGFVFRKALDSSDTIKFEITQDELVYTARVLGLVNIVERRPWSGEKLPHRRRDLRRGQAMCSVKRRRQILVMRLDWNDPLGGRILEHVQLSEDGKNMVFRIDLYRNTANAHGQEAHIRIVFHRASGPS
ncbi:unnamed protein product [Ostreobium quekettii]|uniref:Uncharacterized protein n=1 Tax=Ostreobium quekettii TaxID=121088 RepID=A0A8S1IY54_9CHLO|nr:unnamed protein product [Ostreobium quekettii]|eukprot:evm.model.scf_294.10 EVM.evm.TU.scf_294.10   scf_294:76819-80038(-)